jgi:hypothetical protein
MYRPRLGLCRRGLGIAAEADWDPHVPKAIGSFHGARGEGMIHRAAYPDAFS